MHTNSQGERPDIHAQNGVLKLTEVGPATLTRYTLATKYIKDTDNILEIGCGYGHGALLLSLWGNSVVGVDNSAEAIEIANQFKSQYQLQTVSFEVVTDDPNPTNRQYDFVTAFEIIEHISVDQGKKLIERIKASVKDSGIAIISTPLIDFRGPTYWRFHQHEYYSRELRALLKARFKHVEMFYQGGDGINMTKNIWQAFWNNPFSSDASMVFVCSNSPLPNFKVEKEGVVHRALRGLYRNAKAVLGK